MKQKDAEFILVIGAIILGAIAIVLVYPTVKSIQKGGPQFPEGCFKHYSENITYSGQVITTYPWSDKCCTERLVGWTGRNNYEKVCWKKDIPTIGDIIQKVMKRDNFINNVYYGLPL